MDRYVLGLDIGGTNIRFGLVNEAYELKDFVIRPSRILGQNRDTVQNLIRMISEYLEDYGRNKKRKITAVSMGFPSTIDRDRKMVLSTPNIEGLDNVPIVERLQKELQIPVYIETDVNMLLLYDMFCNHLPPKGIACGFYLGTGFGNAISVDGKILAGKNGAAAELGHIPVRGIHGKCGCGNESCIELIASGYKLARLCTEYFPEITIGEVFTKYSGHPVIRQFIDDLALAAAAEINILDPEYVILGGGLLKMKDFPVSELEQAVYKYARKPYPADTLSYLYSKPGQENGVIGAGILAFDRIKDRNLQEGM